MGMFGSWSFRDWASNSILKPRTDWPTRTAESRPAFAGSGPNQPTWEGAGPQGPTRFTYDNYGNVATPQTAAENNQNIISQREAEARGPQFRAAVYNSIATQNANDRGMRPGGSGSSETFWREGQGAVSEFNPAKPTAVPSLAETRGQNPPGQTLRSALAALPTPNAGANNPMAAPSGKSSMATLSTGKTIDLNSGLENAQWYNKG